MGSVLVMRTVPRKSLTKISVMRWSPNYLSSLYVAPHHIVLCKHDVSIQMRCMIASRSSEGHAIPAASAALLALGGSTMKRLTLNHSAPLLSQSPLRLPAMLQDRHRRLSPS